MTRGREGGIKEGWKEEGLVWTVTGIRITIAS